MKIRLPVDLKNQIEALAKTSGRSMNAEIVVRLQASIAAGGPMFKSPISRPALRVSEDGFGREISVEELARALATELKKC